jgi:C-terminal processing protease CtpA/Prc
VYGYQLLDGNHAQPVTLGLENASHKTFTVTLSREPDPAAKPRPGFEFRALPGGIAYLFLGEFVDDRGAKMFEEHLPEILKAKGLILDVRSNGGGDTTNGLRILSWLTNRPISLPALQSLEYIPTYRAWSGPSNQWKSVDDPDNTYTQRRHHH